MWLSTQGQHAHVVRLAEAEVADRTAEFGADDPETLRSRRSLASALRALGDLDKAVIETRSVVEDSVRVLGSDHADTHRGRADFAQYLAENGKPAEGVRLLRALYTESRAFGPKRQGETRSIRHQLALALELRGEFREALDLLDEEIAAELVTVYGIDEFAGDYKMERLREWRSRLVAKAANR
ncbi:tetratricopeptide repeat protein [Streptomyces sp. NPDC057307]|uniref:tetratricopeptide repeat protein n=1 Tax=Streptomyces sp. NPDC057307 TaxID=3346096 RepID=UPI00362F6EC5